MKILVCGGRRYRNQDYLDKVLGTLQPTEIVHGACPTGADEFA